MPPSPAQARLAEFLETAERLKNERAAAGNVLETVEATPPDAWPSLANLPEFQTNAAHTDGMVTLSARKWWVGCVEQLLGGSTARQAPIKSTRAQAGPAPARSCS